MKKKQSIQTDASGDQADAPGEPGQKASFPIVGIGASAGGLEAFSQLLAALPADTGMGFVLVQHLDPDHESALTHILARATSLPVHEVADNQPVQADQVYVIPPDRDLTITEGVLRLHQRPRSRKPHRPIDSFFESLAQDRHDRAIGVVLSGTANDGTLGLEAIKSEGGITLAQDDSAKYGSMPRSAVAAGCVDLVLPPADIARELGRIAKHPLVVGQPLKISASAEVMEQEDHTEEDARGDDGAPQPSGEKGSPRAGAKQARAEASRIRGDGAQDGYRKILLLLRNHSGVDFSLYKPSTIERRIARRMVLNKQDTLEGYADSLRGNAGELGALYSDVLISVTSFFRNPEAFEALQREVLPELLNQRTDDPVRVWVLGCSTGQEAYSIAMAFMEAAEKAPRARRLQMFATDINDVLLDKARQGLYTKNVAGDLTPQRLRRFFVEEEGGYRAAKMLREMVVFARQDLIADPPFSHIDLISCRNLLIYLEAKLQQKAIPMFHYALKPGGFLILGASESIGGFTDLFEPVDKKHKIYSRKPAQTPALHLPVSASRGGQPSAARSSFPARQAGAKGAPGDVRGERSAQREVERILVNRFAPPSVLVDAGQQVLHFQGSTGAYLEPPAGTASFDVLKMAREGLMLPLRAALNQARKENKAVRREDVHFRRNGGAHAVNLEVIPLKNLAERCFLILFEEPGGDGRAASPESAAAGDGKAPLTEEEESGRIAELETELSETRDYLQSLQEQHESANEELQAAYEEVESANEELQSINEELETSKEELESANEELTTVNEEMSNRNVELDRLNNDLVNLQTSAKLAVVVLGRDLAIRRFSAQAEKQLDLQATDVGRPINHVRHGLALEENPESPIDLETLAAEVISSVREQEYEVRDQAGRWFSLRVRPYITLDNKVDGAVLVLVDIDALKRSEQAIAATRDYAQNVVDTVREPLLVLDGTLRVESANRSFYKTFHATPAETAGRFIYDLGKRQWDIPRLRELLEGILPQSTSIEDFEVTHDFEQLGPRTMLLNARRIHDPQRNAERILLAIEDVTDATESRRELEASEEKYRALFTSIDEGFCIIEKVDGEADAPLDFRYVEANPAFAAQSGVGDVVGKTIRQAFPGEPEEWFETYDAVLRTGESIRFERGLVTQGRVLELFAFRVEGETRRRVAVIFKDITESKRSEQNLARSEQRYRRLFETAKDGILILDADTMRITDANPFMSELLSYSQGEFTGKELWEVGLFRDKSESQRAMRELQESGYVRYEDLPLEGEHGNVQEVELIGNVYRQDDHVVAQCNIRDITERKRMERQIQGQARELADASRRKDEFLAMLSHELRNPMAPIFNALQLIGRQDGENELQREARGVIERQVRHMSRLVDDLLEVSRITTGRIQLHTERVDVNGVVERAVERVRPVIDRRGQQLSLSLAEGVIWLDADSTRLEQVFGNLLNNASKYNEEGGHIELIVERQDAAAVIRIRDDGIGMAPDVLPRVFDLFTQADKSLDRTEGGLGIGLALVKNLVEMHRGTVEAHSDGLGGGSEFVVRLPAASEGTTPREPAPAQPTAMADASRILVVDDNVDAAKMSAMLLRSWGYDVRTAHDGPNALQRAAGFHPNVILLDIGLPGMDGYEVARLIRRDADLNDVRLVAVTGYGQDTDRQRSKEAGFDLHVVKPVEPSALKELLAELHFPTA